MYKNVIKKSATEHEKSLHYLRNLYETGFLRTID